MKFSDICCGVYKDTVGFLRTAITNHLVWQIWFDPEDSGEPVPFYKVLVGFTFVPNDIMLFMVDVEGEEEPVDFEKLINDKIDVLMLSKLFTKYGANFNAEDQIDSIKEKKE